jgi:hypothetical protein
LQVLLKKKYCFLNSFKFIFNCYFFYFYFLFTFSFLTNLLNYIFLLKKKNKGFQEPIVYNVKVFNEIAKEVYTKESLGPPNKAQISEAWENLKSIRWKNIGDLSPNDYAKLGIRSIEVAGFFALGEIIGRFSIIGYNI